MFISGLPYIHELIWHWAIAQFQNQIKFLKIICCNRPVIYYISPSQLCCLDHSSGMICQTQTEDTFYKPSYFRGKTWQIRQVPWKSKWQIADTCRQLCIIHQGNHSMMMKMKASSSGWCLIQNSMLQQCEQAHR